MFIEHVPEKHPEHWIVQFAAKTHPQLLEKGKGGIEFVTPVRAWLKNQATNASIQIIPRGLGSNETQVQITFFKKSEAEHFLACFFHG
jgi:hypothetical protein